MRLLKFGVLASSAVTGKSLFTFVNDGAGVRSDPMAASDDQQNLAQEFDSKLKVGKSEKTDDGRGSKYNSDGIICDDYTARALYEPRVPYNGTLLPERYIASEKQTKTAILHAPSSTERCQCGIELLILVKSSIKHFDRREAIRKRWRLIDPGAVVVHFLVGKDDQDEIDPGLVDEANQYQDMIIGDFHDTYRNLTAKSTLALQWSNDHCANFESLLLVDDDIQLQLQLILDALRNRRQTETLHDLEKVHCLHQYQPKPRALRSGKWAVSEEQYDHPIYPAACTGPAILMSNRAVRILGDTADMTNDNFPIDDVYISGILREKSGLEIVKPDRNNHLVTVIDQKSLNNTSTIADNIL
jgi:hypothetical protein